MNATKNKVRKFKAIAVRSKGKTTRKSFNSNLVSNYEMMLKLYLLNKQQAEAKKELKYVPLVAPEKAPYAKSNYSVWYNLVQVVRKSNQLISTLGRPGITMAAE
jgi:lysyl-tRNA synthetase class I